MEQQNDGAGLTVGADSDRERWLRWRKHGIGGTDAAAIIGEGYNGKGPLDVYIDKTSDAIDEPAPGSDEALVLERGRELEPNVAARYARETGRVLATIPPAVHRDFEFLRGSGDRGILNQFGTVEGVAELKTANAPTFQRMKLDGLPKRYWIQLQHYLEVYDVDFGSFGVLQPDSWKFLRFDVQRDRDFGALLVERLVAFWNGNVVPRIPPAPTVVPSGEKLPAVGGELVRSENLDARLALQFYALTDSLKVAKELAEEAATFEDDVKDRLKLWLESNGIDVVEGNGLRIYYKEQAGRATLDKLSLVAAHPNVRLSDFEKRGAPFRTLRTFTV
jgi:predicted phage-related endonuclease